MSPDETRRRLAQLSERRRDALDTGGVALVASSVLLLLWSAGDDVWLAFTRRAPDLRAHGGQVSLPGGRLETGESPVDAALRETAEELGIDASEIEVLGLLDEAWTGARYRITPVVGWMPTEPRFEAATGEVAEVLPCSLTELSGPTAHRVEKALIGDHEYHDDVLDARHASVRGVTADIVVDLLDWLAGRDRRRIAARAEGLRAFARLRGW